MRFNPRKSLAQETDHVAPGIRDPWHVEKEQCHLGAGDVEWVGEWIERQA